MAMLCVIPGKEGLTKGSGILNGAEPFVELWAVLERFELGFRVRVVVAHVWAAMGFAYPQIAKKM